MNRSHDSIIVQTLSRVLIPIVQVYAVYILFFGQYSPGGGFTAGVLFAASLTLSVLVFGPDSEVAAPARKVLRGDGLGLIVFAGVGGLCLIGGGEFLNYAALDIPGLSQPERRSLGIVLTQIGVAMDIAVTAVSIVLSLSFIAHEEASGD
jgi:multicomponent Na+:H+ antiporter subunit B